MDDPITLKCTGDAQAVSQDLEINRLVRDITDASFILKRCANELTAWMRVYGTDIDSNNLVNDVDAMLKRLGQKEW